MVEEFLDELVILGDDLALHVHDHISDLSGGFFPGDLDPPLGARLELRRLGTRLGRAVELKVALDVLDLAALEAECGGDGRGGLAGIADNLAFLVDKLRNDLPRQLLRAITSRNRDGILGGIEVEQAQETWDTRGD